MDLGIEANASSPFGLPNAIAYSSGLDRQTGNDF
jgi:hypothetical protein